MLFRSGEFNEVKEAVTTQANPGKTFRLAGLVVDAQHRVGKTGKQFGILTIEDYTGKTEFMLWSEDYARYSNYLEKGKNLFIMGAFRPRFNKAEFEFRIERMMLLESIKPIFTKQIIMDVEARYISEELVRFIEDNLKRYPGKASMKFNIVEPKTRSKVSMYTLGAGFEMNDELSAFLEGKPELAVQVVMT